MSFTSMPFSTFFTETYTYESQQSLESLSNQILFVIHQKELLDFKYNLSGSLNTDHTFRLTRRAGFFLFPSFPDRHPVTILGKLEQTHAGSTIVTVNLKPNIIFVLFAAGFASLGTGSLLYSIYSQNMSPLAGGLFLFIVPVIWITVKQIKRYYKSEVEKALDL